jgi:hypothetical protein
MDSIGHDGNYYEYDFKIPDYDYYKIILGPKFVNDKRYFIFPAVIGLLDTDDYHRIGFEISVGHRFVITENIDMEAGIKISWLNVLLKDEGEKTIKTMQLGASLLF